MPRRSRNQSQEGGEEGEEEEGTQGLLEGEEEPAEVFRKGGEGVCQVEADIARQWPTTKTDLLAVGTGRNVRAGVEVEHSQLRVPGRQGTEEVQAGKEETLRETGGEEGQRAQWSGSSEDM